MPLTTIVNKYSKDMDTVNRYIESVKQLLFSLCNTKDDLLFELPTLYSAIGKNNISDNYRDIVKEISNLRAKIVSSIDDIRVEESDDKELSIDDPTADGDLLLYFITEISKGNTDREKLFESSQAILEAMCITKGPLIHGERFYELYDNSEQVYHLIDLALNNSKFREKTQLKKKLDVVSKIEQSLELFDLESLMNIYRHCYIQIMSYFDNCIFELMKICMSEDYFYWLDKYKNVSIKTHDMAKYASFEDFKESHINELLKSCYVKDLLTILNGVDSTVFEDAGKNIYGEIQECIGRRNVHIHNNGIADKAYISGFNIYGLVEGDYLTINTDSIDRVQALTSLIVENIRIKFQKKNP